VLHRSGLPAKHQCCAERDQGKTCALRKAQRFLEIDRGEPGEHNEGDDLLDGLELRR
jgi:hypothetical protein